MIHLFWKNNIRYLFSGTLKIVLFLAVAVFSSSCVSVSTINTHGNLPDIERLSQIEAGKQTKREVATLLGSPSTIDTFDGEVWYYISSRQERFVFYEPKELERNITAISFSKDGLIDSVKTYTLSDSKAVKPISKETPTAGHSMGLLEQFIGNIGRFENRNVKQG